MENQSDFEEFALELRWALRQAGDPSYRTLERETNYSISTFSRMLNGKAFPRWELTEKFLRACHVSNDEINGPWRTRWIALAGLMSPLGGEALAVGAAGQEPAHPVHAGTECTQCGAWVINQIRHRQWHATYVKREPVPESQAAVSA